MLAYVGSAGYYRDDLRSRRSSSPSSTPPATALRQPGSAFKPILYATAFERQALTPGSAAARHHHARSTARELGAARRRPAGARARSSSARRSSTRSTSRPSGRSSASATRRSPTGRELGHPVHRAARRRSCRPGLAGALGTVEVRPLDLTSAYGAIANGGVHVPPRMILEVRSRTGKTVWKAPDAERATRRLAAGRVPRDRHPRRQHRPAAEPDLGRPSSSSATARAASAGPPPSRPARRTTRATSRRTASSRRPATRRPRRCAVGVWMGNSDHSMPRSREAGDLAHGRRAAVAMPSSASSPTASRWPASRPPEGVVRARDRRVDRRPPGPVDARDDAPSGSSPARSRAPATPIDARASSTARRAATWVVDPLKAELGPRSWDATMPNWLARARRGRRRGRGRSDRGRRTSGAGPAGAGPSLGACFVPAEAGPRQRQRARAAARPRAAGWPAWTAAREPAGRDAAAAPPARRAAPFEPVPTAVRASPSATPMARSQCGVDVVPDICHAAGRRRFLASGCPRDHIRIHHPRERL